MGGVFLRRGGPVHEGPGVECEGYDGPYFTNVRGHTRQGKYVRLYGEVLRASDVVSRISRLTYAEIYYIARGCRLNGVLRAFTYVDLDGPDTIRIEYSPLPYVSPEERAEYHLSVLPGQVVQGWVTPSVVVRGLGPIRGELLLYTDPKVDPDGAVVLWRPPEGYAVALVRDEEDLRGILGFYWENYERLQAALAYADRMGLLAGQRVPAGLPRPSRPN